MLVLWQTVQRDKLVADPPRMSRVVPKARESGKDPRARSVRSVLVKDSAPLAAHSHVDGRDDARYVEAGQPPVGVRLALIVPSSTARL